MKGIFKKKNGGIKKSATDTEANIQTAPKISEIKMRKKPLKDKVIPHLKKCENNDQFKTLVNSLPQLVWMANETGWVYWYNDRWYEYTGTKPEEMEGWGWQAVHDPEILPVVMALWKKSIATGDLFEKVFPLKGADGIFRPFLTRVLPLKDPSGKVTQWMGTNTDITTLKHAEDNAIEALRISEERYDLTVQSMSIGVWDWTMETNALYWSKKFKELMGISDENFKPHYDEFSSRLHPDDKAFTEKMLFDHLKRLCPYDVEYRLRHNNGKYIWIHALGQGQWNAKGEAIRMAGSVMDISERKEAEAPREILINKLAESNTELERFAYVASHDMQEPLRMVKNFSRLISEEYADKLNDEGKEYIYIVSNAAERMQAMVDDLLEYARVGNNDLLFIMVDVAEEMKHVIENLTPLIEECNAEITYDDLPQVKGSPVQLMRLLQNLISNGLKYQKPGNKPKLHIGVQDKGNYWCFSVQDNGIGIDDEFVNQVFEPFKRLHVWDEFKGTGIGLAVCKKIVQNHGGKIWITSSLGEGSIFYFTLEK